MTARDLSDLFDGRPSQDVGRRGPAHPPSLYVILVLAPVVGAMAVAGGKLTQREVPLAFGPTSNPNAAALRRSDVRQEADARADRPARSRDETQHAGGQPAASTGRPADPWLTLELARKQVNRGRLAEARGLMAALMAGLPGDEALRAGIVFADETGDAEVAAALIAKLNAQVVARASPTGASVPNLIWNFGNPETATPAARQAHAASPDGRRPPAVADVASKPASPAPAARQVVKQTQTDSPQEMLVFAATSDAQPGEDQQAIQSTPGARADAITPTVTNPFRSNPARGMRTADNTLIINPTDPVLASIERDMVELHDRTAPSLQGGVEFRNHSGDQGLSHLDAYATPLQTTFSPNGVGQVKFGATPTVLRGGSLDVSNVENNARFGSDALSLQGLHGVPSYTGATPGNQQASGVGLDLGYELNNFKTDIGSTPLGFRTTSVLGGVEWAPQLTDHIRLRLTGERRAIQETLLSYAGASDPRTGQTWGGVTRTGGRVQLEADVGKMNVYAAAAAAALEGTHVQSNTMRSLQAGGFFPIWGTATQGVRTGLNVSYFQYDKNLGNFTLGQGGYFSPQHYISAIVPITYHEKLDKDLAYELSVGLGVQSYRESASDYFPIDPQLQALWASRVAGVPGLSATYSASKLTGFAGSAKASIEYNFTPSFQISARIEYQHVGNYQDTTALLLGRYLFNGIAP